MPSILVTGASRGIGLDIATRLARAGRSVVAVARSRGDQLGSEIEKIETSGRGALAFRAADLSDIAALPLLVRTLRKEFGSFQALVNNAGVGSAGLLATMNDAEIERMMRLNVLSPITLTKYVARTMMADGEGGRIVNVSSIVAYTGFKGLAAYSASKAALIGFTRSLARELGPANITVNAIAPGFVDTDLTASMGTAHRDQIVRRSPLGTLVEPADVSRTVEFLLGEGGRHLTGTVLTIDAGATS